MLIINLNKKYNNLIKWEVKVASLNQMHWGCIEDVVGMHGMHEMHCGWNVDAAINKGCRGFQHCGCSGCKRDAERMQFAPWDAEDANGMQRGYKQITKCRGCEKDAGGMQTFSYWMQGMHCGCTTNCILFFPSCCICRWLLQALDARDARRMHDCILSFKYTCNLIGLYLTAVQIWAMNPGTIFKTILSDLGNHLVKMVYFHTDSSIIHIYKVRWGHPEV